MKRERLCNRGVDDEGMCHRSGGEDEVSPVLPSDDMDRLAWPSPAPTASGGVLGTRSGLPACTPAHRRGHMNYCVSMALIRVQLQI